MQLGTAMKPKKVTLPLTDEVIKELRAGDKLLLSGVMYEARDATHKRMAEAWDQRKSLPVDFKGQTIFYAGPSPARPGRPIGSVSPTTSSRMDSYMPRLLAEGLKATIGKGARSKAVKDAMKKYKAVYLAAIGGAAALIASNVKKAEVVAYEDLASEALRRLEVEDFPAVVINDIYGGDLYEEGKTKYRVEA